MIGIPECKIENIEGEHLHITCETLEDMSAISEFARQFCMDGQMRQMKDKRWTIELYPIQFGALYVVDAMEQHGFIEGKKVMVSE